MDRIRIIAILLAIFCTISVFADEPVYIQVIYSQSASGGGKYSAAEDYKGAALAVDFINENGGLLGHTVELLDNRVNSLEEARALAKAVSIQKKVIGVVGANTSNISLVIAPVLQDAHIPMISPISTNTKVSLVGDYIFRVCFTDPFQGRIASAFAYNDLQAKKAVVLRKSDSTYSTSLTEVFVSDFSSRPGAEVTVIDYLAGDSNFSNQLDEIQSIKPDVVFVPGHWSDVALILRHAKNLSITIPFLGGDGWGKGVLQSAGAAAEGHFFVNHWHIDAENIGSNDFVERYRKRFGADSLIAASAPLAYDAAMVLAEAVRRAGSFDHEKIKTQLQQIEGWQGITGTITFDSNGDPEGKNGVIMTYKNGKIEYYKNVSPEE